MWMETQLIVAVGNAIQCVSKVLMNNVKYAVKDVLIMFVILKKIALFGKSNIFSALIPCWSFVGRC